MQDRRALRRRGALLACIGLATASAAKSQEAVSLRALYDESGEQPSALARRLAGQRVALTGLVAPAPSGAAGWLALAEIAIAPCQLCGLTHDWPVGVVAVRAPDLPHIASPWEQVSLVGRLVLDPAARQPAGLPDRLVLDDASLVMG